jgi:hypothetical protein
MHQVHTGQATQYLTGRVRSVASLSREYNLQSSTTPTYANPKTRIIYFEVGFFIMALPIGTASQSTYIKLQTMNCLDQR